MAASAHQLGQSGHIRATTPALSRVTMGLMDETRDRDLGQIDDASSRDVEQGETRTQQVRAYTGIDLVPERLVVGLVADEVQLRTEGLGGLGQRRGLDRLGSG